MTHTGDRDDPRTRKQDGSTRTKVIVNSDTVRTETLGQTCFFLRQRVFLFENWIATHKVSFQELKVGRALYCSLNLNPNLLWPLHAVDGLYCRVVCLQFPKISKKREILNFHQNQNLGGTEISNHQITTNKPRYDKAEFSKTLCCMPKLFPKHSLLIHLLVVEIYHEMSKNKKCPTPKNVRLKFRF